MSFSAELQRARQQIITLDADVEEPLYNLARAVVLATTNIPEAESLRAALTRAQTSRDTDALAMHLDEMNTLIMSSDSAVAKGVWTRGRDAATARFRELVANIVRQLPAPAEPEEPPEEPDIITPDQPTAIPIARPVVGPAVAAVPAGAKFGQKWWHWALIIGIPTLLLAGTGIGQGVRRALKKKMGDVDGGAFVVRGGDVFNSDGKKLTGFARDNALKSMLKKAEK